MELEPGFMYRKWTFRTLVALVLNGLLCVPLTWAAQEDFDTNLQPEIRHLVPAPPPQNTIRIVSFNVHYGNDLAALIRSIHRNPALCEADVFLLQEIESHKSEGASRAYKLAHALGVNYAYAPARRTEEGGTHGLAILSRFPLADVEVIPLKQFNLNYNTRRRIALAATIEVGDRSLRVYNLHLDTRLNTQDRLEQLRPVVEAAVADTVSNVVIGGDFNTNPLRWLFHVVPIFYSGQASAVDDFMKRRGFETPLADAGSTSRKRLLKFRLDALYGRYVHVEDSGIEHSVESSDHAPVWIDVRWPNSQATQP